MATGFRVLLCTAIAVASTLGAGAAPMQPLRLVTITSTRFFAGKSDGMTPDYPGEVMRQVFAAMWPDVSFEYLPASRAWLTIIRGERDGIAGALRTSERENICLFPDEPLGRDRSVFFVRTADAAKLKLSSFNGLAGHNVAVNKSSLPDALEYPSLSAELLGFLREHHNMVETNGDAEALHMLAAGRIDYAVIDLAFGKHEIQVLKLSGTIEPLLSPTVAEQDLSFCFPKKRVLPILVDDFSRTLKEFKQTEAYQARRRKYGL